MGRDLPDVKVSLIAPVLSPPPMRPALLLLLPLAFAGCLAHSDSGTAPDAGTADHHLAATHDSGKQSGDLMAKTSKQWSFDVGSGLKDGHVRIAVVGNNGGVRQPGGVCFKWSRDGADGHSNGSAGACAGGSGNIVLAASPDTSDLVLADWAAAQLPPAHYDLSVDLEPQDNSITWDIQLDQGN
jgi:hypothetical protein